MRQHLAIASSAPDQPGEPAREDRAGAVTGVNVLVDEGLSQLREAVQNRNALEIIEIALHGVFVGDIAVLSSFGAESAVLLHLVSQVDARTPVLFVDTGRMFSETLAYRNRLQDHLGLSDVRTVAPPSDCEVQPDAGPNPLLHDIDACCYYRKVLPLRHALGAFGAVITGRKRYQTHARAAMETVEFFDGRFRFNPLAFWTAAQIDSYIVLHRLPHHPLAELGYPSIGCREPCTCNVGQVSYSRAGRWKGKNREECGIHAVYGAA